MTAKTAIFKGHRRPMPRRRVVAVGRKAPRRPLVMESVMSTETSFGGHNFHALMAEYEREFEASVWPIDDAVAVGESDRFLSVEAPSLEGIVVVTKEAITRTSEVWRQGQTGLLEITGAEAARLGLEIQF